MRVRRGVYTTQLAPIIKIRGDAFRDTFLGTRRGDGLPFSAAFPAPSVRPSARTGTYRCVSGYSILFTPPNKDKVNFRVRQHGNARIRNETRRHFQLTHGVRVAKLRPSCVVGPPWHCVWRQCTTLKTSLEAEAEMKRERASQPETAGAPSQMWEGSQNGDPTARGTVGGGVARKRTFIFIWLIG